MCWSSKGSVAGSRSCKISELGLGHCRPCENSLGMAGGLDLHEMLLADAFLVFFARRDRSSMPQS